MKTRENGNLKMNLQFFADPAPVGAPTQPTAVPSTAQASIPGQAASATVDYAKIQQMLDGTLAAKEDIALKAYFKQQGLSSEEMDQAINTFKTQKAASQPDVNALQAQMAQAQTLAQKAQLESMATMAAVGLGLDAKTIPYVLKMADLSGAIGADGKINDETLKTALNKVLEDVPAMKPQAGQATGFMQVGAAGGANQQTNTDDALKKAFGL